MTIGIKGAVTSCSSADGELHVRGGNAAIEFIRSPHPDSAQRPIKSENSATS